MIWAEKENTGEHLHPQFVPHLISGPAQQPRLSNPKVRISSHLPKLLKEIHLLPLLPKVRLLHFIAVCLLSNNQSYHQFLIEKSIFLFQMSSERFWNIIQAKNTIDLYNLYSYLFTKNKIKHIHCYSTYFCYFVIRCSRLGEISRRQNFNRTIHIRRGSKTEKTTSTAAASHSSSTSPKASNLSLWSFGVLFRWWTSSPNLWINK